MLEFFDLAGHYGRFGRNQKNNGTDCHHGIDKIIGKHLNNRRQ
ncbi:hypothetical protein SDC9_212076 [bioreactor metagenome]|uniref:Uncharacterized protein n=1 Tax=bioreactor metagenome TaxID=1076179 RepID=A0A645JKV8_9ZZZZ